MPSTPERELELKLGEAADRAAFEASENPLYVWLAIGRYRPDEDLPSWVRVWLLETAREISQAVAHEHDPAEAAKRAHRVLALRSAGMECLRQAARAP
jgi:hypothetical protein